MLQPPNFYFDLFIGIDAIKSRESGVFILPPKNISNKPNILLQKAVANTECVMVPAWDVLSNLSN